MRHLVLIPLIACTPHGVWVVLNATPAQEAQAHHLVAAAAAVTGDASGALAMGGGIWLETSPYGLDGWCPAPPGFHVGGCTYPGSESTEIDVLVDPGPELLGPRLAHELCHVGLATYDEARADACGLLVQQRALP